MTQFPRLLASGLIALTACGCSMPFENGPEHAFDVQKAWPVTVEPQVATLAVRVDDGMQGMARGEAVRVHAFVQRWKDRGEGNLSAASPSGSANQAAAHAAMSQIKRLLSDLGVPAGSVQFSTYRAPEGDEQAPVTISFVTYGASVAECGTDWTENLGHSPNNIPWPEFGCSTQHNFAAVVSDPRDIVEPRPTDSPDAARRSTVIEKYRAGQPTQTPKHDKSDEGSVSTVGQN